MLTYLYNVIWQRCCRLVLVVSLGLLWGVFDNVVEATIILPVSLEYMTTFSETIVVGYVKSTRSYWKDQMIMTDIVIDIQRIIKQFRNEAPSELTLTLPGGTVEDITYVVDGVPEFFVGNKMMLFVNRTKTGGAYYVPFGLEYGVFTVIADKMQQQEYVNGAFFDYETRIDPKTHTLLPSPSEPQTPEARELSAFINRIQDVVNEQNDEVGE